MFLTTYCIYVFPQIFVNEIISIQSGASHKISADKEITLAITHTHKAIPKSIACVLTDCWSNSFSLPIPFTFRFILPQIFMLAINASKTDSWPNTKQTVSSIEMRVK